jgi:hypothetical protein
VDRVRQIVLIAVRHDEAGTGPHMHGQHKRAWRQPTIVTTDENGEIHNNNNLRRADEGNANELELYLMTVNDPRFETGQWTKKLNGAQPDWDGTAADHDQTRSADRQRSSDRRCWPRGNSGGGRLALRSWMANAYGLLTFAVAPLFLSACAVFFFFLLPLPRLLPGPPPLPPLLSLCCRHFLRQHRDVGRSVLHRAVSPIR